eukprot:g5857.t1
MSAKEVELTLYRASASTGELLARVDERHAGWCRLVHTLGVRGALPLFLSAYIGALLLYTYLQFASKPWYVLAVAVVAFGLVLYFVGFLSWRWKVDDDRPKNKKQHPAVALFLNVFDPDGKYYLVKTYLSELLEYAVQLYALDVYNCNFPVAVTSTFYALLAVEAVVLALARPTTVRRRNTRVLEDVVLDVLVASVPLMIMRFGYGLSFTPLEFVKIGVLPAVFALSKIYDVVDATVRERAIYAANRAKSRPSRRLSFFESPPDDENAAVAALQAKHTPALVHTLFSGLALAYAAILASLAVGQGVGHPACTGPVWDACEVQVPFCQSPVAPVCDCAVLNVQRHNWTRVPAPVKGMKALKKFTMNFGPLRTVKDTDVEALGRLVAVDWSYNHLTDVPSKWTGILKLKVANNDLVRLPASVWGMKGLVWLEADNNRITECSTVSKDVTSLFLSNNSVAAFSPAFGSSRVQYLHLDGNQIRDLGPVQTMDTLKELALQNNNLTDIPKWVSGLPALEALDLRHNGIARVPTGLRTMRRLRHLYLDGNPVCGNRDNAEGWLKEMGGCKKQCSRYCQDRWLGNGKCTRHCNSAVCHYDNGDCA